MLNHTNPSTVRWRRYRRRQQEGKMLVLGRERNIHDISEKLIEHGWLTWDKAEDKDAIISALGRLLFSLLDEKDF